MIKPSEHALNVARREATRREFIEWTDRLANEYGNRKFDNPAVRKTFMDLVNLINLDQITLGTAETIYLHETELR